MNGIYAQRFDWFVSLKNAAERPIKFSRSAGFKFLVGGTNAETGGRQRGGAASSCLLHAGGNEMQENLLLEERKGKEGDNFKSVRECVCLKLICYFEIN